MENDVPADIHFTDFADVINQSMENDAPADILFTDFADVFVVETIEAFSAVMQDFGKRIKSNSPFLPVTEKRKRVEDFYFIGRPNVVEVQPLDVVRTKGSCSDSGSRLV